MNVPKQKTIKPVGIIEIPGMPKRYIKADKILECDRPGFRTVGDLLVEAGVLIP